MGDRGRQGPDALVVAGLLGQIRKQMSKTPLGKPQELAVVGHGQEHLGHRQGDELGVGDEGRTSASAPAGQEIVDAHVKCDDEGVEVGVHEASMVDVALATPSFGALVLSPRAALAALTLESII